MVIKYEIIVTIINLVDSNTSKFSKEFETELLDSPTLYNNTHILFNHVNILSLFEEEIQSYLSALEIERSSIDVEEFEVASLTDGVNVFFEDSEENVIPLSPSLKCYIGSKNEPLKTPKLIGIAYDSTTIIWSWPEDEDYAHYLIDETYDTVTGAITSTIAQIPIGQKTYVETGLEPDTVYTRRLVNYDQSQTSMPSNSVSVRTETVQLDKKLSEYNIARNYDFTVLDSEREIIKDNLEAFHSGIGDFNDLKVYKQMDADFYQKFKAYFEITGKRTEREKRYSQVGFNYKICLEADEEVEEQEGEVTFDINVYPREWVSLQDYMYESYPVKVKTRLLCTVFLRKEVTGTEDEPHFVYEPTYRPKYSYYKPSPALDGSYEKEMSVIISLDMSSSLRFSIDGKLKLNLIKDAGIRIIQGVNEKVRAEVPDAIIEWIVYGWGGNSSAIVGAKKTTDMQQAIGAISSMTYFSQNPKSNTNFNVGLNHWSKMNPSYEKKAMVFITDGFCNRNASASTYASQTGMSGSSAVLNSITITKPIPTAGAFLNGANHYDEDYKRSSYFNEQKTRDFAHQIQDKLHTVCEATGGTTYPYPVDDNMIMNEFYCNLVIEFVINNTERLLKKKNSGLDPNPKDEKYNGYWFHWNGAEWRPQEVIDAEEDPEDTSKQDKAAAWEQLDTNYWRHLDGVEFANWDRRQEGVNVKQYEIDDYTYVNINIEYDTMLFQHGDSKQSYYGQNGYFNIVTPIEYDRNERRAIIPSHSMFINERLTAKGGQVIPIYNLIMEKVMATNEWAQGYNKTIGTTENFGEEDMFLVRGLMIQNTYNFSDDDYNVNDASFGLNDWEDGWNGSVNTYTDMNYMGTTSYGDDCYLVSRDNYVMMQGYTDAIIYDGIRYPTEELNVYDRPQNTLISTQSDFRNLLICRKLSTLSYLAVGGQNQPYHVVDILRKDDDIYFTGQSSLVDNLIKEKDWSNGGKLTENFIAHNDTKYLSPVLNYRFNIEDPDAKTPIYEILPDCNPYSDYLHIVILHIYYAKNVYITNTTNYIESFGNNPLKNTSDPYIPLVENVYQWTLKEWHDGYGNDNGWYIDNYLWFLSKPMIKAQKYYDEIPAEGMDSMYGLVNGRYNSDSQQGKQDLIIQTPKFNIPTTVTDKHKDSVRIYIMVSEFYPSDALVSYKWERPYNDIDSITDYYGNGGYVTFSSDSISYKDVEYKDLIQTINYEGLEVKDNKTFENVYEIEKPETVLEYENYYLEVNTDNSDVLALRYPTEIIFNGENKAQIPVAFKGVVNATSKWSPIIHNGYYYLNQHEYYAYSEFDVKANFESYDEEILKNIHGYVSIEVVLKHQGGKNESYSIVKNNRSELIQDEKHFVWIDGQGLTLKPEIDGEYYKKYNTYLYTSPVILFPNVLTTVGKLNVTYELEDGSTYLPMEIRSYNLDEGRWNEWQPFVNNSIPTMQNEDNTTSILYSNAYQVRFFMQASVEDVDYTYEDYLCCYLDWKDDMSEANVTNIETITDYITNGPDIDAPGEYISRIIDYGCETETIIDYFDSMYESHVKVYCACANVQNLLLIENITWVDISNANLTNRVSSPSEPFIGRYFRYKIVVPAGEKLYWIHKKVTTKQSSFIRPFIKGIEMTGEYVSSDVVTNFINTESFEIPCDGEQHIIFDSVQDIIGSDVISKGYELSEIEEVNIVCSSPSIELEYSLSLNNRPSIEDLNTNIKASTVFDYYIKTQYTPFIYDEKDEYENDCIVIQGTPQQYSPITVEDQFGNAYLQLFDGSDVDLSQYGYNAENMRFMRLEEIFTIDESSVKFISLKRNNYEEGTLKVFINDLLADKSLYKLQNHLIIFESELCVGDKIRVIYFIPNTFITEIDRINNITKIRLYSNQEEYNKPVNYLKRIKSKFVKEDLISKYEIITPTLDSLHGYPVIENCTYENNKFLFEESGTKPICYITKDSFDDYKLSINIQSTFGNVNANGILIGIYKDENNKYHTLSLVLNCGSTDLISGDDDYPSDCDIFLIYDINQTTQSIIWGEYWNIDKPNGWVDFSMNLTIEKSYNNDDRLKIYYHKWNDNENILNKTFNINYEDYPEILNNFDLSTQFGLLNFMQKDSYFTINELACYNYENITKKHKVYFETGTHNNKFIAEDLSLNPIYRTDYKGFIYLTDEHFDAYYLNIYCNPKSIFAGGYDKVDISIEVLDINKNPIINRKVEVDNVYGILNIDNNFTDMNGVIHLVYESALSQCVDTITAKVLLDDNSVLQKSIEIINK